MIELFRLLRDPKFRLLYGVTQRFAEAPDPAFVRLNREGYKLLPGITKKTVVHPYMRLGVHPSPDKGDAFAPVFGRITDINERSIFVEAVEPDEELRRAAEAVEKTDVVNGTEQGGALAKILKTLGLNTRSLAQECKTLIINGLNPDPGVTWAEPMLLSHMKNLEDGLSVLRRLSPAERIVLAVPGEIRLRPRDMEIARVPAWYPASVDELVVKAVTGKERPEGVGIVGLHNIWSLGRVARTGLPLIETVLTIGSRRHWGNYIVKEGSTVGELLRMAGIELESGDVVVRGGPLRGESLDKFDRSVTRGTIGIFVIEAGEVPPMRGRSACVNCGACAQVCPARLHPGFLSRDAEFALHERNRAGHIDRCMECGLCGYVCLARRPVLQYIRLSKHKLAQADEAAKAAARDDVPSAAREGDA